MAVINQAPLIPEAFLVECDPLPDATDGKLATLLTNHIEVAHQYHLCAQRHGDLVAVVRKAQAGTGK